MTVWLLISVSSRSTPGWRTASALTTNSPAESIAGTLSLFAVPGPRTLPPSARRAAVMTISDSPPAAEPAVAAAPMAAAAWCRPR